VTIQIGDNIMDYQLAQVAIMHYEKELSQQEIANLLGLSKMTVSRMLQKAKEQEIVQTFVKVPFEQDVKLEDKICKTFGLDKAWVFKYRSSTNDISNERNFVAKNAAFIMNTNPPSHKTVGIGIGRMIGQMVKCLSTLKTKDAHVVQLMGGLPEVSKENPFTIIQEACQRWSASGPFLTNFATAESMYAKETFFHNIDTGKRIYELWKICDIAVFSVGAIEKGTLLSPSLVTSDEMVELKNLKAIGDILGHCFTAEGEFLSSDLENRLVSIPIELLKKAKTRRAVVVGEYKAEALRGALLTGVINELVTDDVTASTLF
jgi:deoxyribonucleoside regulator